MQFSGKSIIITGAGKGIGRACARVMAARGAEVGDRDPVEAAGGEQLGRGREDLAPSIRGPAHGPQVSGC